VEVVAGIDALRPEHGPMFVVVGVFDGLHVGHLYLLRRLVSEAAARDAKPAVITFDHHPDEVLTGHAPPLLLDPVERLERLAAAGVAVTVVQPFDAALRETPYDVFVERIRAHVELRGFLMTPDAAFGYEREGTPEALTALGRRDGFEVVLVEPLTLDGRAVRSTDIRAAIAAGDLAAAAALLGRPVTLTGTIGTDGRAGVDDWPLTFDLPVALPPEGDYECLVHGGPATLRIDAGRAYLKGGRSPASRVTLELTDRDATAAR
jgi:riboflavin kinase/FMN adenylyltransferase